MYYFIQVSLLSTSLNHNTVSLSETTSLLDVPLMPTPLTQVSHGERLSTDNPPKLILVVVSVALLSTTHQLPLLVLLLAMLDIMYVTLPTV